MNPLAADLKSESFGHFSPRPKKSSGGLVVRCIYIPRHQHGFGFTLRHFIVYPPESYSPSHDSGEPQQQKRVGQVTEPVDTIFVKSVRENGPAAHAGLITGDRIVSINGETIVGKSYDQVVHLIQQTHSTLSLQVTPKQYDTLQLVFEEKAHHCASNLTNQRPSSTATSGQNTSSALVKQNHNNHNNNHHHNNNNNNNENYNFYYNNYPPPPTLYQQQQSNNHNFYRHPSHQQHHNHHHQIHSLPTYSSSYEFLSDSNSNSLSKAGNMSSQEGHQKLQQQQKSYSHLPRPTPYKSNVVWSHITPTQQQQQQQQQQQLSSQRQQQQQQPPHNSTSNRSHQPQTYYPFNQSGVTSSGLWGIREEGVNTKSHESVLGAGNSLDADGGRYGSMECLPSNGAASSISNNGMSRNENSSGTNNGGNLWNIGGYRYSISTGPIDVFRRESTISLPPSSSSSVKSPGYQQQQPMTMGLSSTNYSKGGGGASIDYGGGDGGHQVEPDTSLGYEVKMVDRIRRSCEQKEEFLKRPNQPLLWAPITPNSAATAGFPKELYAQPQKFQKVPWPPANVISNPTSGGGVPPATSSQNNNSTVVNRSVQMRNFSGGGSLDETTSRRSTGADKISTVRPPADRSLSDYGSAKNRLTLVGSGKLHVDPPPCSSDRQISPSSNHPDSMPSVIISSSSGSHETNINSNGATTSNDETEYFVQTGNDTDVILRDRKRESDPDYDNDRLVRRVSYLKATSSPHHLIDMERKSSSPTTPTKSCDENVFLPSLRKSTTDPGTRRRSMHKLSSDFLHKGRIVRLRQFFEGTTQPSSLFKFHADSPSAEFRHFGSFRSSEKVPDDSEIIKDGPVHFKVRAGENKKVGYYRSWRQGWAQIRKSGCLYLSKERITNKAISGMEENAVILCVGLKDGISIEPADDSKRKNVLRIKTSNSASSSSSTPNPTTPNVASNVTLLTSPSENQNPSLLTHVEILVQADDHNDLNEWLRTLQQQQDNNNYYNNSNKSTTVVTNGTSSTTTANTTDFSPKSSIFKLLSSSPAGFHSAGTNNSSQSNNFLAVNPLLMTNPTSPKSKTWKGKVAKQWKKMQHLSAISPGSSHHTTGGYNVQGIPETGASFGVLLEDCPLGLENQSIPRVIEICVNTIETRGLGIVGIYRIPGNSAAVAALTDSLNKGNEPNPEQDPRWNDVHVISSMLKSFLRNLPDPLLTSERYPEFIRAIADTDDEVQFERLRALIHDLPEINYETLRHLILHLKTVSEHSERNRMEPRNLAIVFGPTLVKTADDSVASLVHDMKHQCKLVEYLINQAYEFFPSGSGDRSTPSPKENKSSPLSSPVPTIPESVNKIENDILASLFQAAQRKASRKALQPPQNTYLENNNNFRQRVRQFEMETRAMLHRDGRSPNPVPQGHDLSNNPTTIDNSLGSLNSMQTREQIVVAGSSQKPEDAESMRLENLRLDKTSTDFNKEKMRLRIESEWRKAKDDLENEDLLDDLVTRIIHQREHTLYPMLSHNLSNSSVSSSNSAGGTVADGSEVVSGGIISPPSSHAPMKLGPTPFKSTYAFTTPSLPPKPPQVGSSSSTSSTTKIMMTSLTTPSLVRIGSVEQLQTTKAAGKESLQRFKKPENRPTPYDPKKIFGSLDSLRDIDLSPRSSDGSDLVMSMSKALDKKLEEINCQNAQEEEEMKHVDNDDADSEESAFGDSASIPKQMAKNASNDETDSSQSVQIVKANGIIHKGRSRSMAEDSQSKDVNEVEKPIDSDDCNNVKLLSYRDPSLHLHRVSDASNSWKSTEHNQPHLKHTRQSSVGHTKESKSASNRLTKESRRHSLSGTADILRLVWEDHNGHGNHLKTKNLSSETLATALAANNILESHV